MGMAAPRPAARRRPGRPRRPRGAAAARSDAVRARLLEVAQRLFAARGYDAVGVRELARAARVSPAMIAYYFRDKAGLLDAVLDRVFERLLAQLGELAAAPGGAGLAGLIRVYVETIGRDPWLPSFILREVIGGSAERRARFAARFPARLAPVVLPFLAREQARGELRADLDPVLAILSLIGMCVFPFLAHPLVGPVFGYELDEAFRRRLAEHSVRLFLDGAHGAKP
jgi:AcrR family transcriptional regulator